MEGEQFSDEKALTSEFNEAALQIMRLDGFWKRAEDNANEGNLEKWTYILDSIWRELRADVEQLSDKDQRIKMNTKLKLKVLISKSKNRTEWYKALNERHEFLKGLQEAVGKGSKKTARHEHM